MGSLSDRASSFFIPLPPSSTARSDGMMTLQPQNLANQSEFEARPFKRPRNSNDAPLNPLANIPPVFMMPHLLNPQINPPPQNPTIRGTSSMFFKTRLCQKFKTGSCQWGNNCNFAHGIEELRQPPPNWQELVAKEQMNGCDQQRMRKNKICGRFYNGGACQYGDHCTYLHIERESSGIAIDSMARSDYIQGSSSVADCNGSNQKPKANVCFKWETTGLCSFGDRCIFAHGREELKKPGGPVDVEPDSGKIGADPSKPLIDSTNNVPPIEPEPSCTSQTQQKKGVLRILPKKIIGIYADWIDGIPLPRTSESEVELDLELSY